MIELRISPGGRRSLVQVPPAGEPVGYLGVSLGPPDRTGRKMGKPFWRPHLPEDAADEMMYVDGDDIDANFQRLQQEKNALYSKLMNGDPEATDAIQLRIHAQIRLLSEKMVAQARERNPISTALVHVPA